MKIEKILAVAFMCHQMPERSFFVKGKKFPLCARCTGILAGYIVGTIIACITRCSNYQMYLLLIIPMILDGGIQQIFKKESNNMRRFFTGLSGGIAIVYLFICIHFFTIWWVTELLVRLNVVQTLR